MSDFSKRLKLLRRKQAYTQDQLAELLGISRSSLAMYEQGRRSPDFETLEAIADIFNVDIDYLLRKREPSELLEKCSEERLSDKQITHLSPEEQKAVFAQNLKYQLAVHDKTQIEVSKAIDVNPTTFNNWCTGLAFPRMEKVQALANYFGILKSQLIDSQNYSISRQSHPRFLSSSEEKLLGLYNQLNPIGKEQAIDYISYLSENKKYTEKEKPSRGSA